MKSDTELLKKLLNNVSRTQEDEIDCQEVYELIDLYAEAAAQGQDAGAMLPLVRHHLEMCAECLEEYQALLAMLSAGDEG
jgi:uncharacterized protein (UPF0335 family)